VAYPQKWGLPFVVSYVIIGFLEMRMSRRNDDEDVTFFDWVLFTIGLSFLLGVFRGFRDE